METYQFEHSEYLYGLVLIPILLILFWIRRLRNKGMLRKFGDLNLINQLMPDASPLRIHLKYYMLLLAVISILFAASGFKVGSKVEEMKQEGVELVIALDISNSMLAEDLQPNRLERARQAIIKLLDELNHDKFGLIVFAGEAYTQLPLTMDYGAAKMMLNTVDTRIAPNQGTAIGAAVELATKSFSTSDGTNRAIVIISDGENHEDDAIEAVRTAHEKGIIIHTIGMGLAKGAPIPSSPGLKGSFRTNSKGEVVISKLNETMLMQIAAEGGGSYIRASNTSAGLKELFAEISKMDKMEMDAKVFAEYEDQFQYFVAIALFFLLLEFIILARQNRFLKHIRLFDRKVIGFVLLLIFVGSAKYSQAQSERKHIRSGNKSYELALADSSRLDSASMLKAENQYRKAIEKKPDSNEASFNLGNALFKQGKYPDATGQYQLLLNKTTDKKELSELYYNLGNSYFAQGKLKESLEAYKNSLRNNPNDTAAKYNLAVVQKLLNNPQQQQQDQQNEENQEDQNQDQQQDQQQQEQNQEQKNSEQENNQQQGEQGQQNQENQGEEKEGKAMQEGKISKEDAEKILQRLQNEEQKVLQKLQEQKSNQKKRKIEKDW
jgi:tetratricopeptide (TPR) repeat protein